MALDLTLLPDVYADAGSSEALLNSVLAFLAAKTDFYEDEAQAEAILRAAFQANRPQKAEPLAAVSTPSLLRPPVQPPVPLIRENGFDCGSYSWTQTLTTVEVIIPLQARTRTSNLAVELAPERLTVQARVPAFDLLPRERLFSPIIVRESLWSLVDGQRIELTLVKARPNEWWRKLFESDANEVDAKTITPETINSLAELDLDTRATVEKMMQEQRLKNLMNAR